MLTLGTEKGPASLAPEEHLYLYGCTSIIAESLH